MKSILFIKINTFLISGLFLIILFVDCTQQKVVKKTDKELYSGVLKNYKEIAGCGWVIELNKKLADGNEKLEPINMMDFKINLKEGQPVVFTYKNIDGASVCMMGKLVSLISIKEK